MSQLQYMAYKDEEGKEIEVRIITQVEAKWKTLADLLKLPDKTGANEEAKPCWTPNNACRSVFATWLDGEGREPHSWDTVIQTLKEIGSYTAFIEKIKHALAAQQISRQLFV